MPQRQSFAPNPMGQPQQGKGGSQGAGAPPNMLAQPPSPLPPGISASGQPLPQQPGQATPGMGGPPSPPPGPGALPSSIPLPTGPSAPMGGNGSQVPGGTMGMGGSNPMGAQQGSLPRSIPLSMNTPNSPGTANLTPGDASAFMSPNVQDETGQNEDENDTSHPSMLLKLMSSLGMGRG